jgi:lysophospholipase L1-like esterase
VILVFSGPLSAAVLVAQVPVAAPETTPAPVAEPETKATPAADAGKAAESSASQKTSEQKPKSDSLKRDRFKEANLALGPPAVGENRVVFMGDSITQGWKIEGEDSLFPGKHYINRGINGQTTPQMLVRFRRDVIDLKPKAVVILAGINDIAGNSGPMTIEETEGNLASMAELASVHHIRVVMCSLLPAVVISWKPGMTPAPKVQELNEWIKSYTAENGHVFVDYYTPMKDERGGLPPSLSSDGVHPRPAGYAMMAPLVEAGIEKALKAGIRD